MATMKKAPGVDLTDPMTSFDTVDSVLERHLPEAELTQVRRVLYGKGSVGLSEQIPPEAIQLSNDFNFEVRLETLVQNSVTQSTVPKRVVRIGAIQNSIAERDTSKPINVQRQAMYQKMEKLIDAAGLMGINVLCLQEAWPMPFAFCTREKYPWCEFAEDAERGPSARFVRAMARKWNMIIISPILERDAIHGETIWNTAVVFGDNGEYIGKSRKNHIPRVGDFNEANYYLEGDTGHRVFATKYGRIAINICYGRHHPLNWMMYGLNGAEIVFNPSATVGGLSEPMWGIEARNAAIANSYFTVAINRIGTESFPNEFTSGNGKPAHRDFGHFYGSTHVCAPDASRTPSLSRIVDGVLGVDVDLNQRKQIRDFWTLYNTARFPMYAQKLSAYVRPDYRPEIVVAPGIDEEDESVDEDLPTLLGKRKCPCEHGTTEGEPPSKRQKTS